MQSGTKLVVGLAGVAIAAGIASWWYRYESAHRSTEFWGPVAAEVIARPERVNAFSVERESHQNDSPTASTETLTIGKQRLLIGNLHDVTSARGMMHLGSLLLTDRNFNWQTAVEVPRWRWGLRFEAPAGEATVVFDEDFEAIGLVDSRGTVRSLDCRPLALTLREYFTKSEVFGASTVRE